MSIDKQYKVEYTPANKISPENLIPGESSLDWSGLTVSKNSVNLKGLEPLTKYRIRVAALGKLGQVRSGFREIEIMTDPAPVQGLRLYRSGIRWLKFVWDAPNKPVDGYEVTLLDEIGFDRVKDARISKNPNYRFEGLEASTWYRVQVKVIYAHLQSLPRVILAHTELHEPRAVKLIDTKESSAKIMWDPVDEQTSARITLISDSSTEKVVPVGEGQNVQELLYLTPNTVYNVKVQLKKNRILSEVAEIEFRTKMPEQIPILKLVQVQENETKG